jgi:hypothetical protein
MLRHRLRDSQGGPEPCVRSLPSRGSGADGNLLGNNRIRHCHSDSGSHPAAQREPCTRRRNGPPGGFNGEELARVAALRDKGVLTTGEFETQKQRLLRS